jgi:hypothetical protein
MWEPRRLTTLWASTACYRDSFTYNFACNTGGRKSRVGLVTCNEWMETLLGSVQFILRSTRVWLPWLFLWFRLFRTNILIVHTLFLLLLTYGYLNSFILRSLLSYLPSSFLFISSRDRVTVDGVWIGNRFIAHLYNSSLHVTNHYRTH